MTHAQIRPVVQVMERLQETGGLKGTDKDVSVIGDHGLVDLSA